MNSTRKKVFLNGVGNKEEKQYAVFATPNGFLVTPTFVRSDKKMVIDYNEFYTDIFLTDEDKVLEKINEFLLEETGEKQVISLIWGSDVDKEIANITITNKLICDQFDRE